MQLLFSVSKFVWNWSLSPKAMLVHPKEEPKGELHYGSCERFCYNATPTHLAKFLPMIAIERAQILQQAT